MHRFAFLLVLALLPAEVAAGVRWGVVGITQWSRLTGVPPLGGGFGSPPFVDVDWASSPAVGAIVALRSAGPWAFEAEPQLSDQCDELSYGQFFLGGAGYESRVSMRMMSIALPLRAVWRPRPRVRLGAGPELRYLARATATPRLRPALPHATARSAGPAGVNAIIFEDFPATYDVTSSYRRWGLGASLVAGYAWPMGEHEGRLDVRWARGFTDLTRLDEETRAWEGVQASLGVLW